MTKSILIQISLLLSFTTLFSFPYTENFETIAVPPVTISGDWELGSPSSGPMLAYEGSNAAATNLSGNYSNNATGILSTPLISLPDAPDIYLSFYDYISIENNFDSIVVEVEQNGSGTWIPIMSSSRSRTSWQENIFDVTAYRASSIKVRFRIAADGSENKAGWYVDQISIDIMPFRVLKVKCNTDITYSCPLIKQSVTSGDTVILEVEPNFGYDFLRWNINYGSVTFDNAEKDTSIATVIESSQITAEIERFPTESITETPTSYNHKLNAPYGDNLNGVWFDFTPQSIGSYVITINDESMSTTSKVLSSYGTDTTYISKTNSYWYNANYLYPEITSLGLTYYFSALQQYTYTTYSSFNISWRKLTTPTTLSTSNNFFGYISTFSSRKVNSGETVSVLGTPRIGYGFSSWVLLSGSADIVNPTQDSTDVILFDNSTITAEFTRFDRHTLSDSAITYNFITSAPNNNPDNMVWFEYTPSKSGNFLINSFNDNYHYLKCYGSDTTYYHSTTNESGSGHLYSEFNGIAGTPYFCSVYKSSTSGLNNNFTIEVNSMDSIIEVSIDTTTGGRGSVGQKYISIGSSTSITAYASMGYTFKNWTVVSGDAILSDSLLAATTVQINTTSVLKPIFESSIVILSATLDTFSMIDDASSSWSGTSEVLLQFSPPDSGSYMLSIYSVDYYRSLDITYCGTRIYSCFGGDYYYSYPIFTTFTADYPDEIHYFSAESWSSPSAGSDKLSAMVTLIPSSVTLTADSLYENYIDFNGPSTFSSGDTTQVEWRNLRGHKFIKWVSDADSNIIDIISPDSSETKVSLTSSATIKPLLKRFPRHAIDTTHDTLNLIDDSYDNDPRKNIWLEFIPTESREYKFTAEDLADSVYKSLAFYGTDTTYLHILSSKGTEGKAVIIFAAIKDSSYTFSLGSYSTTLNSDIQVHIQPLIDPVELHLLSPDHGYTTTENRLTKGSRGDTLTLKATAYNGYELDHWHRISGTSEIIDSTSKTTQIIMNSDTEIRAIFKRNRTPINLGDAILNFEDEQIAESAYNGVWLEFITPDSGTYIFETSTIGPLLSRSINYFGTDSTYRSSLYQLLQTNTSQSLLITSKSAGEKHVINISSSPSYITPSTEISVAVRKFYPTLSPIYHTSFESTDTKITPYGDWETGELLPSALYTIPDTAYHGQNVLATVINNEYSSNADDSVIIGPITVSDEPNLYLTFKQWISFHYSDDYTLSIRENGSNIWSSIISSDISSNRNWNSFYSPLDAYRNKIIYLKFRLRSDNYDEYGGWYIDDLTVGHEAIPDPLSSSSTVISSSMEIVSSENTNPSSSSEIQLSSDEQSSYQISSSTNISSSMEIVSSENTNPSSSSEIPLSSDEQSSAQISSSTDISSSMEIVSSENTNPSSSSEIPLSSDEQSSAQISSSTNISSSMEIVSSENTNPSSSSEIPLSSDEQSSAQLSSSTDISSSMEIVSSENNNPSSSSEIPLSSSPIVSSSSSSIPISSSSIVSSSSSSIPISSSSVVSSSSSSMPISSSSVVSSSSSSIPISSSSVVSSSSSSIPISSSSVVSLSSSSTPISSTSVVSSSSSSIPISSSSIISSSSSSTPISSSSVVSLSSSSIPISSSSVVSSSSSSIPISSSSVVSSSSSSILNSSSSYGTVSSFTCVSSTIHTTSSTIEVILNPGSPVSSTAHTPLSSSNYTLSSSSVTISDLFYNHDNKPILSILSAGQRLIAIPEGTRSFSIYSSLGVKLYSTTHFNHMEDIYELPISVKLSEGIHYIRFSVIEE